MKIDDILKEFGEYVKIVEQPEYSKKALLDFQKRYQISTRLFYIASRLDFGKILAEIIPDYEDWLEHIHDYLKYGGDLSELDPSPISFPSCNNGKIKKPRPLDRGVIFTVPVWPTRSRKHL